MEEEVHVALLNRHSRGVEPTNAGALLYRRAKEILAQVDQCMRELSEFQPTCAESLSIGASASVLRLAASFLLAQTNLEMPEVTTRLVEDTSMPLLAALTRGDVDVIIAHELPPTRDLHITPLLREQLLFVSAAQGSAHPHAPHLPLDTVTLEEALRKELTLPIRLDGIRRIIETAAEPLNLKCRVTYNVQSHEALKILIAEKNVASVLPYGLIANELSSGTLYVRRIVSPPLLRTLVVARSSRRLAPHNEDALKKVLISLRAHLLESIGALATPL